MEKGMKYALIVGAILVGATIGFVAYISKSDDGADKSSSSAATDAVMTDQVNIKGFAYEPKVITVKKGTKVTWTNNDRVEHTVTSSEGAPAAFGSELFGNGKSFSYTFDKGGTYDYYCEPHPYMKGTVIVTE